MINEIKNKQIAQTFKETKQRHSNMNCRTFEIKVVNNKLNRNQKESINNIFKEAKWLRNAYLNDRDNINDKTKTVPIKVKDEFEYKDLEFIGSQIKQSIIKQVKSEIKSLSTNKKKGRKVGKLKFKSYCNSIELKQFNTTYSILFNKNRIRIQNIKKPIYVRGLKQIPTNAEITNAKFVRKASGLYFYITCFLSKEENYKTNKQVGIDFGIEHNLTLSDNKYFDLCFSEDKNIKRLSRKMNRAYHKNGLIKSHNHYKRVNKLRKAYLKDKNKKIDKANKIVNYLLNNYDFIAIQDEMIHNWHSGLFGRQVQYSAMGYIKAKLKHSLKVHVVERSFPSTQICPNCGSLTKHPLKEREYNCSYCNYHHPSRDIKSAQSILDQALYKVSMERRAQSLVEVEPSFYKQVLIDKVSSVKQEAHMF